MGLAETFFNGAVMAQAWPLLMLGLRTTLLLGGVSIVLGALGGLGLALARLYGPVWARLLAVGYTDLFRAFPLLVLLIVIYYALPFVGVRLSSFAAATAALSLVSSAYTAEIFRAGIEAVPKGQLEAARAVGLRWWPVMRRVVLPQALRMVVPPLTGNCVNVVKETSLASVVAMPDLLKQATQAQALAANPSPLIAAALIYLACLIPLVRLVGWLERRGTAIRR